MPDMLGIDVFLFIWQTQLLRIAKAVENVKRRYKQMYIYFALCRQDNEGDKTPRNTVVGGETVRVSVGTVLVVGATLLVDGTTVRGRK
jgi:hypothetical protein